MYTSYYLLFVATDTIVPFSYHGDATETLQSNHIDVVRTYAPLYLKKLIWKNSNQMQKYNLDAGISK